jgi:hypothetical protein
MNTSRLADLRDRNEYDELVILTSKPSDLPALFEAGDLTVSQFLIVGELMSAMGNVQNVARQTQARERIKALLSRLNDSGERPEPNGVYPFGQTETRNSDPFADDDDDESENNDPFGLTPEARSDGEESAGVSAFRKLFEPGGPLSSDPDVQTVNGPVRLSEVPKDANGQIDPEWIEANCNCEDHQERRAQAAERARGGFREEYPEADRPGLYV